MNHFGSQPAYPPHPGNPPYPPPPKKRMRPGTVILLVIGAIILFCGGGLGALTGAHRSNAPQETTAAAPGALGQPKSVASPATKPAPGLQTPVRDGKFEFVVTGVQSGVKTLGDNEFLQKTAQGEYTIVSLTVRNTSTVPYGFSPSDQYVFDNQNRKFGNDAAAAINLQADTSLYADINPGNTITARVVFDLPPGSDADHIVLHDSMFSGGATVLLRP